MTSPETPNTVHRLDGLEPDNLLAFLALLGLLRAIAAADRPLQPRASWSVEEPPLRPRLHVARAMTAAEVALAAAEGVRQLAAAHTFGGRKDLNYSRAECRTALDEAASVAGFEDRARADLLAALMSDGAVKATKGDVVIATPLCLMFGQGHQHFLERLADVPALDAPPPERGRAVEIDAARRCLAEALFEPWHREDPTNSFRWDPNEDVRYAMMAGDPADAAFKAHTQHGANRLAAVAVALLTAAPVARRGRVGLDVVGGRTDTEGYAFAWPIWREPATLSAIVAMLAHPLLHMPDALRHLGVVQVLVSRRISVGRFMNFTRARPPA